MVLEAIPKTAGARPPTFGGPPVGTTFSNEPDDRDDMIVTLRDNVCRLVRQADTASPGELHQFMRLLEQRRGWIKGELDVHGMMTERPAAPLGIQDNPYDLSTLNVYSADEHRLGYQRLLEMIDSAMGRLWERVMFSAETGEA